MLYSIGKDSSVMLRLAQKAFHPGPIPFPLLHVDTTYKFREMIQFRDEMAKTVGARLIVHTNQEAIADGTQPFKIGTQRCCGLLKTKALLDALEAGNFDAALGGARRDEERSRAKERIFSVRDAKGQWDPEAAAAGAVASAERQAAARRDNPRVSTVELDRDRRLAIHPRRTHSSGSDVLRHRSRGHRPWQLTHRSRAAFCSTSCRRHTAGGPVPHAVARLLAVHRGRAVGRRHGAEDHRGACCGTAVRAAASGHRSRPGRIDGAEEAGRVFLMSGLLRICTAGSVDDGKSTLIGRMLHDAQAVYEDQVHSVRAASRNRGVGPIDFSLFTDGLKAEREQGITIDVAYRYFATARRKFILADTPGHEQYTRNMATGASTADLAILLVDASQGVRPQSRRHARIAGLLGIEEFVLAVNKMDLVDFRREVFEDIRGEFEGILGDVGCHAVPLSALHGDNVTTLSDRTPWFRGPTLLEHLETVNVTRDLTQSPFRFPVQLVITAGSSVPRLRRPDRLRHRPRRRCGNGMAVGAHRAGQADRDLRRRSRSGVCADVGHARPRR